jgi:hypothetical protein
MFVPRYSTKPIFYSIPGALQMFFDKIIPHGRIVICKAVLLLPVFSKYLYDVHVFSRLPGLFIYIITPGRANFRKSTGIFKLTTCDKLHTEFKFRTIANTDGMGNCLWQP